MGNGREIVLTSTYLINLLLSNIPHPPHYCQSVNARINSDNICHTIYQHFMKTDPDLLSSISFDYYSSPWFDRNVYSW